MDGACVLGHHRGHSGIYVSRLGRRIVDAVVDTRRLGRCHPDTMDFGLSIFTGCWHRLPGLFRYGRSDKYRHDHLLT